MLRLRPMTRDDLSMAMRLQRQAGWNQTEADWLRQLELQPDGCFVAEVDGMARGTTCTCVFGSVAWVAMVLVDVDLRGRGIGRAMVEHAVAHLEDRGIAAIRLDATSLGRPLYEKLGFVTQFELARWEGLAPPSPAVPGVRAVKPGQLEQLLRLDREVVATDRRKLLLRLHAEQPASLRAVVDGDQVLGFGGSRAGANAVQLGPCIADSRAGSLLLADAFHRYAGHRVYLDVPLANVAAIQIADSKGLAVQRHFLRMCRGEPVQEDVGRLWASFGPEKG